ncbi:hypothetical protein D9613_011734 [Agrocybe pediades]|uniref:Serine-tRNA synthetase type1 N-terminal domain-containing protein n=1 Tax=Agrocybe pediades TaxID=84607 RepID=A0A8H4VK72_9AGAR|nr:hypothetical protein D9613_011734 [Agrocybe pediades]
MTLDILHFIDNKGGNAEEIRESQRKRGHSVELVDEIIQMYADWVKMDYDANILRKKVNEVQKEISAKKKAKQPADDLVAQKKEIDAQVEAKKKEAKEHEILMRQKASTVGNIVGKNVPVSLTEENLDAKSTFFVFVTFIITEESLQVGHPQHVFVPDTSDPPFPLRPRLIILVFLFLRTNIRCARSRLGLINRQPLLPAPNRNTFNRPFSMISNHAQQLLLVVLTFGRSGGSEHTASTDMGWLCLSLHLPRYSTNTVSPSAVAVEDRQNPDLCADDIAEYEGEVDEGDEEESNRSEDESSMSSARGYVVVQQDGGGDVDEGQQAYITSGTNSGSEDEQPRRLHSRKRLASVVDEDADGHSDEGNCSEGWDVYDQVVKKHAKQKSFPRGEFRNGVAQERSVAPALPRGAHVVTQQSREEGGMPSAAKRPKMMEKSSGLLAGWKGNLAKQQAAQVKNRKATIQASNVAADQDSQEYAGGEFDEDETAEQLQAAATSKMKKGSSERTTPNVVAITRPAADIVVQPPGRVKKVKYLTSSLPFPAHDRMVYHKTWRKTYRASLVEFGATSADPFGTNATLEGPAIELWNKVYPNITSVVDPGTTGRDVVIQLAGDLLIAWRSSMGKLGISTVVDYFINKKIDPEAAPDLAAYLLQDARFIYEFPDVELPADKGAFRSDLVAPLFAAYLKTTAGSVKIAGVEYGQPISAIAVAAATVERGLELIRTGKIDIATHYANGASSSSSGGGATKQKKKMANYFGYGEAHWGKKTRAYALSAQRLSTEKWDLVRQVAASHMNAGDLDVEDDEEGIDSPETDARAMLDI